YTSCASSQGYAPASYELGSYYELVEHNYPKALGYYQVSVSQGGRSAAFFLSRVFGKRTPPSSAMWYTPDEKLEKFYYSLYLQIDADPDLRFPNLVKDNPLPPHPVQGYDAARPDWKPGQ
ncbi:sel1 repeat family protein, partial [Pseudomonas aeruginosa]|nr:sel1 repeat family protein [Pseudomonas aeruginosa]ELC8325462.1 sel1 repeat family protein [Pseudomonas aeruginosa]ELX9492725.1 sel1 repeat family protein [Pseudomonas aeruginosa]HBO4962263.1 sel1 repeat family protein [Pseudomonas aeruginosa]